MDKFDLDINEKDIFGSIDRLLVNLGMVLVAFFPTHLYLLFSPKRMAVLLLGEEGDGRIALRLGPGITFVITILFLLGVAFISRDILNIGVEAANISGEGEPRRGIRSAISEGNFWRSIVLSLPIYLMALIIGIIFHLAHIICRLRANLTQSISVGLYVMSTLLLVIFGVGLVDDFSGSEDGPPIFGLIAMLVTFFIIMPWQFYGFSRHAFQNRKLVAVFAAIISCVICLILMGVMGFISSRI